MSDTPQSVITVTESGNGPFAQFVSDGRHVMAADEPERLGGRDTGPSPYEYLQAGLGACTAMTVRMYATRQNWPLENISVAVRHEKILDSSGAQVDRFERVITLTGALGPEQRARLLEIASKCPVSQTLSRPSLLLSRLAEAAA